MTPDKNVFILGAGFSAPAKAPLMKGFASQIRTRFNHGAFNLHEEDKHFKSVLDYIDNQLAPKCARLKFNLDNIEEVASHIALLANVNSTQEPLYESLVYVICRTLEQCIDIPGPGRANWNTVDRMNLGGNNQPYAQYIKKYCIDLTANNQSIYWLYDTFATTIAAIERSHSSKKPIDTIISFNYDLILDYAIRRIQKSPYYADYALPTTFNDQRAYDEGHKPIKLLKLHGSSNWMQCTQCKEYFIMPEDKSLITSVTESHVYHYYFEHACPKCNQKQTLKPLIIPPAWNKSVTSEIRTTVWRTAIQELQDAEKVIIIGYSFPPQDGFFKYLLSSGITMNWRKFIIFDTDPKIAERYKECFQPSVTLITPGAFDANSLVTNGHHFDRP